MYDCIIIGSGPAGLSAALNLKIYQKDFIWFGSRNLSEKVRKAEKIVNYPGIPMASGNELMQLFQNHMEQAGLTITEKTVTNIMSMGNHYMVLADNDLYESKTLIFCTGVVNGKTLEHEDDFLGRGVSYCATCDGMFYRGKKIAVISNDPKYEHEVRFLAGLAEQVYFFPSYPDPEVFGDNITVIQERDKMPAAVDGNGKLSSLRLKNGEELALDGVFCLRNAIAPAKLLHKLNVQGPHIEVNRAQETNLPGCYAAGDCTGRPYQYTKAVGEGNVAAHSCVAYLAALSDQSES